MKWAAGGGVAQDLWGTAGEAGWAGSAHLQAGSLGATYRGLGLRTGGGCCRPSSAACFRDDPALHPVRSVLGPQRRKLLAAGEEAFTRWFPAGLGKPPEDPLMRTAHLAWSWDSGPGVTRALVSPGAAWDRNRAHPRGAEGSIPQAECAQKLFHKSLGITQ